MGRGRRTYFEAINQTGGINKMGIRDRVISEGDNGKVFNHGYQTQPSVRVLLPSCLVYRYTFMLSQWQ